MARIELRDGWHEVPDHVAALLARFADQLYSLTYEEALKLANEQLLRDRLNATFTETVAAHLRVYGR